MWEIVYKTEDIIVFNTNLTSLLFKQLLSELIYIEEL
jgi:hypothetical protein